MSVNGRLICKCGNRAFHVEVESVKNENTIRQLRCDKCGFLIVVPFYSEPEDTK